MAVVVVVNDGAAKGRKNSLPVPPSFFGRRDLETFEVLGFVITTLRKFSKSRPALTVYYDDGNQQRPPHDADVVGAA